MEREIKFRVWCSWAKKMLTVGNIQWNGKGEVVRVEAGETGNWLKDGWYDIDKANIHLMQYTGLKDKNGKEIYEGDILTGGGLTKYTISWDRVGWYPFTNTTWTADLLEIIGNIFENPELLEKR